MKTLCFTALITSLAFAAPAVAQDKDNDATKRLAEAGKAFSEIMAADDKAIPGSILDKAECVAIIPGMKKGGFIVGGSFGRGAVSCRSADKKSWGAPAMIEMGGGSVGLQLGASATDVVMLIMNREGMDNLLKDKFTLGGDASVAAGPVGRAATAETDASMKAKILSYSRSSGVFGGVALKGSTLKQDNDANKELYGKPMEAAQILSGKVTAPANAGAMTQALAKYSPVGK
jgi:lipid-binding SYLF domain-containing protein